MRSIHRHLLYLEGFVVVLSGALCLLWPSLIAPVLSRHPTGPGSFEVMAQLGAVWVLTGMVAWTAAMTDDKFTLRRLLIPLLAGDVLHVWAVWPWDGIDMLAHVAPTTLFFINRFRVLQRLD